MAAQAEIAIDNEAGRDGAVPALAYVPELDGLRAAAAILVILFHAAPWGVFAGAFIGVDIFFVLSAFLITGLLVREREATGGIHLGRFYLRRFLRLTPPLLLLLVVYLAAAPWIWPGHPHGRDALLTALYLSDYSTAFADLPKYLQHSWSLAVEEHFYLIWPLLLLPLLRSRAPVLVLLLLAWLVLTEWRLTWSVVDWQLHYYRFDTRATGLVLGAFLFFAVRKGHFGLGAGWAWFAAAALILLALTQGIHTPELAISGAEIAAALLVGCLVTGRAGRLGALLRLPAMVTLGRLSYGIYLWHYPFVLIVRDSWNYPATVLGTLAFAVTASALSYHSVEAWSRRMKDRAASAAA